MELKKYCKSFTAIIISFLICFMSVCSYSMIIKAESYSCKYYVFDAKTAKHLYNRDYTLNALPISDNNPTNVSTMSDDRYIDWNKSGVVKIMTGNIGYNGTGFVVSPHVIATAAHVIQFTKINDDIQTINSIYLFDKNGNKTLEATPVECHVPSLAWNNGNSTYDYALITVKEDLSEYACFDLGVPVESIINNTEIKVTGFPKKVNDVTVNSNTIHAKYSGTGKINSFFKELDLDKMSFSVNGMYKGDSGCPIYVETKYKDGQTYCTVLGINSQCLGSTNYAVKMSLDLMHFYINNKNLNW